jgi:hypothetical protein
MTSISELSVDELTDGICLRAGRIAAAQAELLRWIAEFDRREGWAGPGMLSCAHWLSWRIGMSLGTARDQVRVARRLPDLPPLAAAFADGRVSHSKVRAITRVADPDDGIDWVALGPTQLRRTTRRTRARVSRAHANEHAQHDPDAAAWRLRTRTRYDEHGNSAITIRADPPSALPVGRAGLAAKKAQLQRERDAAAAAAQDKPTTAPPPSQAGPTPPVPRPARAHPPSSSDTGDTSAPAQHQQQPDQAQLDDQAPGWPAGTTRRQLQEAMKGFTALQADLRCEQTEPLDTTSSAPTPADFPAALAQPSPASASAGADSTEPAAVTDADALLALAQDASIRSSPIVRPPLDAADRSSPPTSTRSPAGPDSPTANSCPRPA